MTRTIMYGAFSCLVAGGAAFLVCTMRPPYAILATAVLPGLSLGCAWLSLRALPGEPVRRPSTRYAVPWKLVAIMAVAGLLSGSSAWCSAAWKAWARCSACWPPCWRPW